MDDSLAQRKCVLFFLEGDLMTPPPPPRCRKFENSGKF